MFRTLSKICGNDTLGKGFKAIFVAFIFLVGVRFLFEDKWKNKKKLVKIQVEDVKQY